MLQAGPRWTSTTRPATVRVGADLQRSADEPVRRRVEGSEARLADGVRRCRCRRHLRRLAHGRYRFGVRANHLSVSRPWPTMSPCRRRWSWRRSAARRPSSTSTVRRLAWVAQLDGVHLPSSAHRSRLYVSARAAVRVRSEVAAWRPRRVPRPAWRRSRSGPWHGSSCAGSPTPTAPSPAGDTDYALKPHGPRLGRRRRLCAARALAAAARPRC